MERELLDRILTKGQGECELVGVGLYNWTEPLLHPRLDELVGVVHAHGLPCDLSSNLNNMREVEKVLRQNPRSLRISNSGFTQELYGVSHRGGNIETVKQNMKELLKLKNEMGSTTLIELHYHRYRDNLGDEMLMREYCAELGIGLVPVLAFFTPVEKVVAYLENDPSLATVTDADRDIMGKLLLPLEQAMEIVKPYAGKACLLQEAQITIDFRGAVQLCCATYDSNAYTLCDYLTTPLADIQGMKYESSMCTKCLSHGIHVYYTAGTGDLNKAAAERAPEEHRQMMLNLPSYVTA